MLDISEQIIQLKGALKDAIDFSDFNIALKAIDIIHTLLISIDDLPETDSQLLNYMLIKFKWIAFANLDDDECLDLLENNLAEAFTIPDLNLEIILGKKIDLMQLENLQLKFATQVLEILEKNVFVIGKNNIIYSNGKVEKPQLANWIKLYKNFPSSVAQKGNLEEVKFLGKDKNAINLDKDSKEILASILRVYDLIRNFIYNINSLPVTDDEEKAFQGFNLYSWLPGINKENVLGTNVNVRKNLINQFSKLNSAQQPNKISDPADNLPKIVPILEPKLDLATKINSVKPLVLDKSYPVQKTVAESVFQKPSPGLNYGGLRQETNTVSTANAIEDEEVTKIKQEIESKKSQAQAVIDKKLQGLKKKLDK